MIAYTGGTTGRPKGVVHSQHRLALNLLAHVQCGEILPDEVMLLTTPLPHSAGYHLQACLLQGGKTILEPKFDPARLIDLAKRFDVTWTFAVPTMLYRMFDCLNQGADIPRSLRTVVYGAAPMSQTRLQEGIARLGHVFLQLYGQTECPNYITTLSKADHREEALQASCGRAVVMLDMRIRTPDDSIAGAGEVGEIEVSSPYQLIEYYRDSDQTRSTIVNGWLKTGDLGFCDEQGHLFLVDRAKDMIISGGMNVYCAEVETALQAYSAVGQAAVVGEPHPDWGEAVIAFVTTRAAVDEADIRVHLRTSLSGYKIPKRIIFIDDLPLTKYGKVDKKALRLLLSGSAVSS